MRKEWEDGVMARWEEGGGIRGEDETQEASVCDCKGGGEERDTKRGISRRCRRLPRKMPQQQKLAGGDEVSHRAPRLGSIERETKLGRLGIDSGTAQPELNQAGAPGNANMAFSRLCRPTKQSCNLCGVPQRPQLCVIEQHCLKHIYQRTI